ncbi:MAG TPA: hypothetical protein VK469_11045 [Candidatus Kapabacteria bacterium]|nr:hypothetical protein [Candidatus Kapabacteria bacterium]
MNDLTLKFDLLGFDLCGLENLIYLSEREPLPPPDCPGGKCTLGCYAGCATCSPGCSAGGK